MTDPAAATEEDMSGLLRPPTLRHTIGVLDRALFAKTVSLAAVGVADKKKIAQWRQSLQKDNTLLLAERLSSVVPHPDRTLASQGARCLLLDPKVQPKAPDTWTPLIRDGLEKQELSMVPYDLSLDYAYWSYEEVIRCLLPPELREVDDGVPTGFNQAGHVAHLTLREKFWPHKKLIAEVLMDKNPGVRTVINKVADVGSESEFRTFGYEVLAGDGDLGVEARENDCVFQFDYAKVYWNSKLEGEHRRLIHLFKPGEVVCDAMAGIGPFAVPAGKRGVFVWANDYNPESYKYLDLNIKRNKVAQYVQAFNEDGRVFIKRAADLVYAASTSGAHALPKQKRISRHQQQKGDTGVKGNSSNSEDKILVPPTISHFVMNLPASAITFLPHYRGIYAGHEQLFEPYTNAKLPMVHVHCFAAKADGEGPMLDVCERITNELGAPIKLGDPEVPGEAAVLEIRAVAPSKRMFCASFRIPAEVAFAARE
ncbi:putative tRNA wybutosine-synthesizing protein 2 [Rosellinia necatrix]|uniref:tRNA (guanine(37)-N1)-methyltransferase n=1 Tax=Rosellinia necatrix TaxID=77044 RepID=A0A1S7UJP2_ROSNE|nr:putative tRNA wybutosine-synthesizing protein 2 [Rosellinia necatrix]